MATRKSGGAMVYWIEADTGQFRCESLQPSDLYSGGSYEHEAEERYARNPIDMVAILFERAGGDWEKGEVARLKAKAEEMRAQLGGST